MKYDYIDIDRLSSALEDAKGLIEENRELKHERDRLVVFVLLMLINSNVDKITLPEFTSDTDLHRYIADRIVPHINIGQGYYEGGRPVGCYAYFSIKGHGGDPNSYHIKRTPDELKTFINEILRKYENNEIL